MIVDCVEDVHNLSPRCWMCRHWDGLGAMPVIGICRRAEEPGAGMYPYDHGTLITKARFGCVEWAARPGWDDANPPTGTYPVADIEQEDEDSSVHIR